MSEVPATDPSAAFPASPSAQGPAPDGAPTPSPAPSPAPPFDPTQGPLTRRRPGAPTPDALLAAFLDHVSSLGLTLYPAQEEALLELFEGRHVVLTTPTGSGKSLVALGLQFKAFCEGRTSVYTSPVKALVNEKFFALCDAFGPDNVGMLTGDASINRDAPVLCCTAEILANLALREGADSRVAAVVMDEFHYYADKERGWAWQAPLLTLRSAQFLLMSATLGDTQEVEKRLQARTGRDVTRVHHGTRPVPLDFEYRTTAVHETIGDLASRGRAPVYVVHFTQRAAAERAQDLTSTNLATKDEKFRIAEELLRVRFDTPYGKELQRFLKHGIGLHHAGLVPKYRRLVERLAQANLLRVICGTDTLGVGVNIPLRTVLFTQLCKFDGEKTIVLPVRDFLQVAGRAGRKGFDDRGWVVAQAPEHVIENLALEQKAAQGKKVVKKKPPEKGYAHWDDKTFERLQTAAPEKLDSRFDVTHGMLLQLLRAPGGTGTGEGGGYRRLLEIIGASHESDWNKRRLKRKAAILVRTLRRAGIVSVVPFVAAWPKTRAGSTLAVHDDLQLDFAMYRPLSLYLVETLPTLDRASPTYALDLLSLVEAVQESPKVVLAQQVHRAKGEKVAELKAQGMEFDQRMEELEKVEHPKPNAEFTYRTFNDFADRHPWIGHEDIRPKSIAREMIERGATFNEYVRELSLERSEGVLLRYLADVWRTLRSEVPTGLRDEVIEEHLAWLHATLASVDSSLLDEWEALRDPERLLARARKQPLPPRKTDPAADPRAFAARIRAELQLFTRCLAKGEPDQALAALLDSAAAWTPAALTEAVAPLLAAHGGFDVTPRARAANLTQLEKTGPRTWRVRHTLLAADGDDTWFVEGSVDLSGDFDPDAPLTRLLGVRS